MRVPKPFIKDRDPIFTQNKQLIAPICSSNPKIILTLGSTEYLTSSVLSPSQHFLRLTSHPNACLFFGGGGFGSYLLNIGESPFRLFIFYVLRCHTRQSHTRKLIQSLHAPLPVNVVPLCTGIYTHACSCEHTCVHTIATSSTKAGQYDFHCHTDHASTFLQSQMQHTPKTLNLGQSLRVIQILTPELIFPDATSRWNSLSTKVVPA